jgi:hypothetical protein
MSWSVVRFGKHARKTLPQIVLHDPDWFFWAIGENAFEKYPPLGPEAKAINSRARKISIPNNHAGDLSAEYLVHEPTGTFLDMRIVRTDSPAGKYSFCRKKVIDLSVPRSLADYDKLGCKILLTSVKALLFGDRRMTRKRCEAFFDDPEHFA